MEMTISGKWDGITERRSVYRQTRRQDDAIDEGSGLFRLLVGIGLGAVLTIFWALVIWFVRG